MKPTFCPKHTLFIKGLAQAKSLRAFVKPVLREIINSAANLWRISNKKAARSEPINQEDLQKTYTQEVKGWTLQSLLSATHGIKNSVSSPSLKDK